ncbi:DeoR/GlpR family DNA-binding transcription regulator [Dactylosporangium sp. NPDC000521]|uniref:DeoR/GlpR family DNA-binding transcription regulator n=1 Tax=Dactylosporangium sp. NPDC000521 TaxID=3363975 RepID=UPI00368841A6
MPAPDRLDLTLRLVRGSGRLTLAELATRLGVSEMTVRRDLDQLQEQGLVRRVRGGAVALDVPADEAGFDVRAQWRSATKARLASATAALIAPGSTVLLDAGTTTAAVAAALATRFGAAPSPEGPLTVAVLSLQAAVRLADQPGIRLLILGGESRAGERSLVGPLALSALDQLRFDTFIMSIGAVHHDLGWSEFDLDDAAVKRAALRRAGRTVVVADASKLGVQAFARVAPLSAADIFVTSAAAPPAAPADATSSSTASAGGAPSGSASPHGGAADPDAAAETLAALRAAGVDVITTDNPEESPS